MLDTERLCIGCMNDNGGEKVCSICGYDSKTENDAEYLPARYWIKGRYYVGRVLDCNGEGVTYIGWDNKEDTIVNIREYFPKGAAVRAENGRVAIEPGNEFTFNEGIMNFLELNRKLMGFYDLPALLPVVEVFEENGTAYSITKAVSGITLREFLIRNGGDLTWEQARPLFLPVITTLSSLHEAGIIHRGISPETILVGRDGKLRLTGFCIRPVRMSESNMVVQLFPGYSAVEQYDYEMEHKDGKYTDVYGLAATLFRVLMGKTPTDIRERISNDNMQIPARYAEKIPKYVLAALANALQIMPVNRTQDMDAFRISLTPVSADTTAVAKTAQITVQPEKNTVAQPAVKDKKEAPKKSGSDSKKYAVISAAVTAVVFIFVALAVYFAVLKPKNNDDVSSNDTSSSSSMPSSMQESIVQPTDSTDKMYQVPNLIGKKFADVVDNNEYTQLYTIVNAATAYSDDYERGYIIDQEPKSTDSVKKGTEIRVTVSAGSQKVAVPNVVGKTKEEAISELLKQGFLYENIKVLEVYDSTKNKNIVVETEPAAKTKISRDEMVTIRVNAYQPTASSSSSSQTSSAQ